MDQADHAEALHEGLKRVAVALKEAQVPFALAGGYAAWVRGSPEPLHDVDFLVRESDADSAGAELARRGMEVQQPADDWLFKVRFGEVQVDVLHRAQGPVSVDEMLEAAEELSVLSVRMPVLSATDVTTEKLLALDEHYCDLAAVLPTMRALREQVAWDDVRRHVEGAPFAEAVLYLMERLDIIDAANQSPTSVPAD